MLHTFNSTAYEVAEWNFNNLKAYNLIDVPTDKKAVLKIGQIRPTELLDAEADGTLPVDYPDDSMIYAGDYTVIAYDNLWHDNNPGNENRGISGGFDRYCCGYSVQRPV